MIGELRPYSQYSDFGLPWLRQVPAHWRTVRNGNLFAQRNETGHGDLPILEVSLKTGVRLRGFGEGGRKQIMSDLGKYKRAAKGDLAYNTMRMWQGALGVCPVDGLVSPAYVVVRPYAETEPRYFAALFRTESYMAEIDSASSGIVKDRNRLYWEQFKQMRSPCPPPEEQAAIVRFLGRANGRLERAIRAKRKVIALLDEQKQAIIHRAVTRGPDPSVPLKPSGVPWFGDVPANWEVAAIGSTVALLQTGPFGSQLHSHEYVRSAIPVINPSHMSDGRLRPSAEVTISQDKATELARHMLRAGDVVIARRGVLGRCALVTEAEEGWICGTGSLLLRLKTSLVGPAFFQIVFASRGIAETLSLAAIGATMANINERTVARQRIPLPPLADQERIVDLVRQETEAVQLAAGRLEREIDLLREYRTRLVADVVTGKLDVREAAARLPAEAVDASAGEEADPADDAEVLDEEAAA